MPPCVTLVRTQWQWPGMHSFILRQIGLLDDVRASLLDSAFAKRETQVYKYIGCTAVTVFVV